jgi:hypothetical protein
VPLSPLCGKAVGKRKGFEMRSALLHAGRGRKEGEIVFAQVPPNPQVMEAKALLATATWSIYPGAVVTPQTSCSTGSLGVARGGISKPSAFASRMTRFAKTGFGHARKWNKPEPFPACC